MTESHKVWVMKYSDNSATVIVYSRTKSIGEVKLDRDGPWYILLKLMNKFLYDWVIIIITIYYVSYNSTNETSKQNSRIINLRQKFKTQTKFQVPKGGNEHSFWLDFVPTGRLHFCECQYCCLRQCCGTNEVNRRVQSGRPLSWLIKCDRPGRHGASSSQVLWCCGDRGAVTDGWEGRDRLRHRV